MSGANGPTVFLAQPTGQGKTCNKFCRAKGPTIEDRLNNVRSLTLALFPDRYPTLRVKLSKRLDFRSYHRGGINLRTILRDYVYENLPW